MARQPDDHFKSKIRDAIARRVGLHCSKCRVLTSGPHSDPSKASGHGVAAHIHSAMPSGPRYDEDLPESERHAAPNGIWLCSNCHALVDKDADAYSASQLRSWKEETEQWVKAQVLAGQPVSDSLDSVVDLVVPLIADGHPLRHGIRDLEGEVLAGERPVKDLTDLVARRFSVNGLGYFGTDDACAALKLLRIATPNWWKSATQREVTLGRDLLQGIFDELSDLVGRDDFVLFSSVQEVLGSFLEAQSTRCLELLDDWMDPKRRLHQLFALNALPALAEHEPTKIYKQLVEISQDDQYQETFLLSRAFLLPIRILGSSSNPAQRRHHPDFETQNRYELNLLEAVKEMVCDPNVAPEIRCLGLATLPSLALPSRLDRVEELIQRVARDEGLRWGFYDLVVTFYNWPKETNKHPRWHLDVILWLLTNCPPIQPIMEHIRHATFNVARAAELQIFQTSRDPSDKPSTSACCFDSSKPGIAFYPEFVEHTTHGHFECRERVQFAYDWLSHLDNGQRFHWMRKARRIDLDDLRKVHHKKTDCWPQEEAGPEDGKQPKPKPWEHYIDDVQAAWDGRSTTTKSELPVRVDMYDAALYSAGAVLDCVDYVHSGGRCAWALNRPPGHLANNAICLFNNVAAAALYARDTYQYRRIIIIDFDAHCGVHTSRCCEQESEVMYVSLHENTSYDDSIYRRAAGDGSPTLHVPYDKSKMGDQGYRILVDEVLRPVLAAYGPDLIFLSAGFDGHNEDPLNSGYLGDESYRHLATRIIEYARGHSVPIVGTIEGGYGLRALARCLSWCVAITGGIELDSLQVEEGPPHLRFGSETEESKEVDSKDEIAHSHEVIKSLDLNTFLEVVAKGRR